MFRGEDASKQVTSDFLTEESEKRIEEAQRRLEENERREKKKVKTKRDFIAEDITDIYYKNASKKLGVDVLIEKLTDYVMESGIILK